MKSRDNSFPLPEGVKPHEAAILFLFCHLRTVPKVAAFLHYKKLRPVQIVVRKYRKFLADHQSQISLIVHESDS